MNDKTNSRMKRFTSYYHETIKGKICSILIFILGALSMMISSRAVLLVFIALFVMPLFFTKEKRISKVINKEKQRRDES